MKQTVIGLSGHIDHGKTALVQALTGVDTDCLTEEKKRGMTIDLGSGQKDYNIIIESMQRRIPPKLDEEFVKIIGSPEDEILKSACILDT